MARVLYIGDVHEPVAHPGYLSFCMDLREKYRCDRIVFIGDLCDWHAISFHAHHPEAPGPQDEYELALKHIRRWYTAFPEATCCIGNHDERLVRLAETVNIPARFLRDYRDIWQTPGWNWVTEVVTDDVYAFHGTGTGGIHPAYNSMLKTLMSVVQGHIHSAAGIKWRANPTRRIFGMDTGCGIDDKAVAFAYGQHQKVRSVLGAGVVLDGIPFHEIMPIGTNEKYNRSRFRATRLRPLGVSDDALFDPANPAVPVSQRLSKSGRNRHPEQPAGGGKRRGTGGSPHRVGGSDGQGRTAARRSGGQGTTQSGKRRTRGRAKGDI